MGYSRWRSTAFPCAYFAGVPSSLCTFESTANLGGSYCPQPIHVAFDAIFVGASWIAKRVCFALEVTPDFVALASRAAATAAVKPKTLATRKTPPQKNAPLKKQVSGESKNPRNG